MEHGGRGFRLPEIPSPALGTRSKTFSQSARVEQAMFQKTSFLGAGNGQVISLQTKMFDFYDSVLKEVERLALSGQEDVAIVNSVKQTTGKLLIPLALRQKITPEMFSSKAKQLVTLMERIQSKEPIILRPPPTKAKQRKTEKPKVGRLSPAQLKLNIGSTVMCTQLKQFDVHLQSESTLGEGRAIPLCIPNDTEWNEHTHECKRHKNIERTSLKANPQALRILREISGPVCVLAVVGPCRTGKSYVLGRLISNAGENCQFKLGHKMDPETMGIWMWDRPFKLRLKNGEEVTMVLIDTEGIDAASASDQSDSQIFTLSVLISSLLIYNSMTVPRREDLQQMHFVANLSKSIQVQAGKSAEGTEGVQLSDSNPRFMWLLRDVILEPTDKKGRPCHIKDYLLQKVLVPDATDDEYQQRIRQCLLSFFSAFDAETLPPPSTDAHVMRNIENPLYQKDISPYFLQKVEYVRKRILDCCTAKRGFGHASKVNGFQLAKMVQLYIDALNSPGGVPVVGSTWQRVLEATYETAVEEAVKSYQSLMDDTIVQAPMEESELLEQHSQALTKSMEKFQQATSLDAENTHYESYLNKLMGQLVEYTQDGDYKSGTKLASYLMRNRDKSREKCAGLLRSLREKHLVPVISELSPEMDFHTIETAFIAVVKDYQKESVGPAADEMLEEFIKEQEEEQQHLEGQLSTIKNYDAEAKQRMAELREQELAIERSENKKRDLEQKLEQSKKDQQAKLKSLQDKFLKDQENLKAELEKQHQQHEKRLTSMADANMMKLKKENEEALRNLRSNMERDKANIQQRNKSLQSEISRLKAELNKPRPAPSQPRRKGGCFAAGTRILLSNTKEMPIEKQAAGLKLLAHGGETTTITEEYVDNDLLPGQQLFGINNDNPFASFNHPFWTTEGWKCLEPEGAVEENPNIDFKLLQVGDIVFRIAQTNPLLYEPVKVHKFTFMTVTEPSKIYGLHLDGPRSYHANGYVVAANYPVLTKKRVCEGIKKLNDDEKKRLKTGLTSVQGELTKVLGTWAESAFKDMELVDQDDINDECD